MKRARSRRPHHGKLLRAHSRYVCADNIVPGISTFYFSLDKIVSSRKTFEECPRQSARAKHGALLWRPREQELRRNILPCRTRDGFRFIRLAKITLLA